MKNEFLKITYFYRMKFLFDAKCTTKASKSREMMNILFSYGISIQHIHHTSEVESNLKLKNTFTSSITV